MYFNYKTNSFSKKINEENIDCCIEVSDDVCQTLFDEVNNSETPKAIFANEETHYPEVRELEIEANPTQELQNRISELKRNLASTDYQAIKYAEGYLTEDEYKPIKLRRQAWREEINLYEMKISEKEVEIAALKTNA